MVTDRDTGEFDFVLLTPNLNSPGVMTKFIMSSYADSEDNFIAYYKFQKVLNIDGDYLNVVLGNSTVTRLYKINLLVQ